MLVNVFLKKLIPMKRHFVYILCSEKNGTLYVGVTHNLAQRVYQHQKKTVPGFSSKYDVCKLVYVEQYSLMMQAVAREKKLKKWNRQWKINLIEKNNPEWKDLSQYLMLSNGI
jgi:putative endonuclease